VLFLQKIMGGHETGGSGTKLGGLCPPARVYNRHWSGGELCPRLHSPRPPSCILGVLLLREGMGLGRKGVERKKVKGRKKRKRQAKGKKRSRAPNSHFWLHWCSEEPLCFYNKLGATSFDACRVKHRQEFWGKKSSAIVAREARGWGIIAHHNFLAVGKSSLC